MLYSEYFKLKTICDGNVLETVYMHSSLGHGTQYNLKNYSPIFNAFNRAGLQYCMPCAGLTEVSTTKIAKAYRYAMGCMRGRNGQPCNNCMKCFRKRAIQGNPISTNLEVEKKLCGKFIPMLPSLLWARDNKGLSHPILDSIDKNVDWVDKWYSRAEEFIPEELRNTIRSSLNKHGIIELCDPVHLEGWVSSVSDTY